MKRDHEKRVEALRLEQGSDALKAKLIEMNDQLVGLPRHFNCIFSGLIIYIYIYI